MTPTPLHRSPYRVHVGRWSLLRATDGWHAVERGGTGVRLGVFFDLDEAIAAAQETPLPEVPTLHQLAYHCGFDLHECRGIVRLVRDGREWIVGTPLTCWCALAQAGLVDAAGVSEAAWAERYRAICEVELALERGLA